MSQVFLVAAIEAIRCKSYLVHLSARSYFKIKPADLNRTAVKTFLSGDLGSKLALGCLLII